MKRHDVALPYSRPGSGQSAIWAAILVLLNAGHFAEAATLTLDEIIDNVRANENLFENCEATLDLAYVLHRPPVQFLDTDMREVTRSQVHLRYILQNGMFRVETDGTSNESGLTAPRKKGRVRVFDGTTSRVKEGSIVNVADGRILDEHIIRPHMMIVQLATFGVPLSTYLKGHEAIAAYAGQKAVSGTRVVAESAGQDNVDDHPCHKVICRHVDAKSGYVRSIVQMWLASDRNWIPIRCIATEPQWSETKNIFFGSVAAFREIEPGVWCPLSAKAIAYDNIALQNKGVQTLAWSREYTLGQMSLAANYPMSTFQEIEVPDGAAVYELNNGGDIVRSHIQGAPESTAESPIWKSWLVVVNARACNSFCVRRAGNVIC